MTSTSRDVTIEVASLAAAVERAAGDLAMSEEPSGFLTALDEGADDEARGPETARPTRR